MSENGAAATGAESGIYIENLTKRYEDITAVNSLNLVIPRGQFFAFLGPNGAGKTTTIKMLTGLIRPTSGRTMVAGYNVQENPKEAKQRIGYIPDHPYLYEKLSGRDFFHFVGDLFSIPRAEQEQKLDYYFNLFSLQRAADKLIENYSHGMRQKLVISASLMHDPDIIIVDEPMVGLDPQSAKIVKNLFRQQTEQGRTIFLSTHVLSVAEELADRIGIIKSGELIFLGTIDELQSQQNNTARLEDLFLELTDSSIET
jgi:ABC-2 type transport system ATP-binding protein